MKKIFLLLAFFATIQFTYGTQIFWVGGSANGSNWNTTSPTNWSGTSGGTPYTTTIPTSTDDVIFDANGNSNSII